MSGLRAPLTDCCSDLKAQYEVQAEEGLDTFVVIDGLPKVPESTRAKLVDFLLKHKISKPNKEVPTEEFVTTKDAVFMPVNAENNMTEGCVSDPEQETQWMIF